MSPPACMSRILIISYMFKNAQMHEASPVADWEKKRVRMRMVNEYGLRYMNLIISFQWASEFWYIFLFDFEFVGL